MLRTLLATVCLGLLTVLALICRPSADSTPQVGWRAFGAIQPRLSSAGNRVAISYQRAIWTLPTAGGNMIEKNPPFRLL
jgi:hypothetical protein